MITQEEWDSTVPQPPTTWLNKTPIDIMADINAALQELYIHSSYPDTTLMSIRNYWYLFNNHPARLMLVYRRIKRTRRPKQFIWRTK